MENVHAKVFRRLMPFLFLCYILAYLDRINIGFAKLQMAKDLHLGDTAYGVSAGIFFVGYLLLEVPSNLILVGVGARRWIARIMIAWGIVSAATAFVHSTSTLCLARFLLGAAEAGFFPGVLFYFTLWFPERVRASVIACFMTAVPLAGIIGGPISGAIMQGLGGAAGLAGWRWLFFLEGIPAVLVGIAVLRFLDDGPATAHWLTSAEKAELHAALLAEASKKPRFSTQRVLRDGRAWLLSGIHFCFCLSLYGVGFWLPQLLANAGAQGALRVGVLSMIPYGAAALLMVWVARRSDISGERRRPIVFCAALSCVGLVVSVVVGTNLPLEVAALSAATAGILAINPLFWALSAAYFKDTGAAVGFAMVNSLAMLSGFVGPTVIGVLRDAGGSAGGFILLAVCVALGGILVMTALPKVSTLGEDMPTVTAA